MELGDKVIYYTHEASDNDHRSVDQLAFVIRVVDDATFDLMVVPPGGPVQFVRAGVYDEEGPIYLAGGSYVREFGSDAPEFNRLAYSNDPDWIALRRRQLDELNATPVSPPSKRKALAEKHLKEQQDLDAKLEAKYQPQEAKNA
jgi:hypothetical protein